jgi:plasmid stabilization system protein ParE
MSVSIVFRSAAEAELDSAAVWYQGQRQGLGDEFMTEVQRVLDQIAAQPARYPLVFGDVREAPVHRFPYAVYYRVKPQHTVVIAVFHCSRNPAIWRRRR